MVELTQYKVELTSPSLAELSSLWQSLEARSEPNFFLSWCWVETWINTYTPDFQLIEIRFGQEVVGLGLLTKAAEVRHKVIWSRVLRLGQTGNHEQDQIWIEYNDLLLDQRHKQHAPKALMAWLLKQPGWDEFQLGASDTQRIQYYEHDQCEMVTKWSASAYHVNLAALRKRGEPYLKTLSRNTRYQIKRSEKLYHASGELMFTVLSTEAAIEAVWPSLSSLHIARWGNQVGQSGFVNREFIRFHLALVQQGCKSGMVEVCQLTLNGESIGLLYNFLYKNKVYFYLSGLQLEEDSRMKPGLLIHYMAIEHYKSRGYDSYDFMGGDAQYKRSLGQRHCELAAVSIQRQTPLLLLERGSRRIKHKLMKRDHPGE